MRCSSIREGGEVNSSLMPAAELAQKQVGIMAWIVDIVQHGCAANLAGVVDDNVAKAQNALPYG